MNTKILIALGNFLHFAVVGVVLLKALMAGQKASEIVVGAVAYSAFAIKETGLSSSRKPIKFP